GPDEEALKPIFQDLEFKTMINRVFGDSSSPAASTPKASQLSMFGNTAVETSPASKKESPSEEKRSSRKTKRNYKVVDKKGLKELIGILSEQKEFSIDSRLKENGDLETLTFSCAPGEAYAVQVDEGTLKTLKEIFADDKKIKVGHNLKATILALKMHEVEISAPLFDTMIAHYLIEPEAAHDLEVLAGLYLDYELMKGDDVDGNDQLCEQADYALQLKSSLQAELEKRGQSSLMRDVEMPLVEVLASMEYEGVTLDTDVLSKMSEDLRVESEKIQKEIFELADQEFNVNSPKQLGEILFDKMKLGGKPKKTKTGQYATGEDVLNKLAGESEIVKKILDYREYEKLRSTYVDALPKLVDKRDGRIHTDYRQAVAATGRLSSNNPNLQNIPIRTEKGRQIRKAFVPRSKDFRFMSADYSQIELRIAASFAKDEIMIDAFKNKRDIHTTTAAKVFKVPIEQVTPDMRRKAKEVNFGILYGSTAFGLAQNLNISRSDAAEIITSYFTEFAAIKRYMDESILNAREVEYVETILGRRRYLRDINSRNITTRGFAERNAINAPIQGSAADIIKIAMVNIHRWMKKENVKSKMIMQVHDELVFDVHKSEVDLMKENVTRLMQTAVNLEVPMEVEVGVGANWLEAH
ncbi:MAG: DNA polymerase I, partial [Cyclobacteriaceae bacterium]|nr:DNA polymerase I [Cyclobacteriaceae bacterium]